jgi:hypothetical protein
MLTYVKFVIGSPYKNIDKCKNIKPVPVAARSGPYVYGRSPTAIVGSK